MSEPERIARRLLATGCWVLLGTIAVMGLAILIPPVGRAMTAGTPTARYGAGILVTAAGLAMFAIWIGAVWHAAVDKALKDGQRVTVILLLLIGNALAGLFYYFGRVRWRPAGPRANAAV
jgi:hypothetical protein